MKRARWNVYLEPEHAERLQALADKRGLSKSSLLASALLRFLAAEGGETPEAVWLRRLDTLSRQFDRLERDQTIQIETLALFIRHQLAVSVPVPDRQLEAARAQGKARFEQFIDQLARHLQRGGSLVREVWQEISPSMPDTATETAPVRGRA
jgi:hypothetical protein